MSAGHLPECRKRFSEGRLGEFVQCICTHLRDCEQRVAAMRKDSGELWLYGYATGFQDGHSDGLDAAREAVAAVPHGISWGTGLHIHRERALAAIDALKERTDAKTTTAAVRRWSDPQTAN